MFNPTNEEKKLDWMYKGPNSLVEREEYLLGRAVDKTLEQLNEEEKQKQHGLIIPKNRVEHECIPPSIRDFNKVVQAEQVDLSAKLQEDPLVAIKKREEESRRQFLQNPVQLKKLQKALKAQQAKKKKKKRKKSKHTDSDSDIDKKLTEKILSKKNKKASKEERDLDTILIHKYEEFKDKLTESDLQDILNGKITDSDSSSAEEESSKKRTRNSRKDSSNSNSSDDEKRYRNNNESKTKNIDNKMRDKRYRDYSDKGGYFSKRKDNQHEKHQQRKNRSPGKNKHKRSSSSDSDTSRNDKTKQKTDHSKRYESDDSDSSRHKNRNYGLVNSDGVKIPLSKKRQSEENIKYKSSKPVEHPPLVQKHRVKKLTEEEKEKLRQEMMENAVWRDKERIHNVKKYHEKEEKERKEQSFDPEFIHKQLLQSAHNSSVESRIKANVNNIQRSSRDMDKHFSKR